MRVRVSAAVAAMLLSAVPAFAQRPSVGPTLLELRVSGTSCRAVDVLGLGTAGVKVLTNSGTVTWTVGSGDGGFDTVTGTTPDGVTTGVTDTTGTGSWRMVIAGYAQLRLCVTGSGASANAIVTASQGGGGDAGGGALNQSILDELVELNASLAPASVQNNIAVDQGMSPQCEYKLLDNSALPNLASTEGYSVRFACAANGIAYSILTDVGGLQTPIKIDDGAFTQGTSAVLGVGFIVDETPDTADENDIAAARVTPNRILRTAASGYLSGGGTPVTMLSDNTDNDDKTAICTGPCTIYSITAWNHAATSAFLRCEADTSGNTTPGSETASAGEPDEEIPGNTGGAGMHLVFPVGKSYTPALTCWIATGEASTDTVDAGQNDVRVSFSLVQ